MTHSRAVSFVGVLACVFSTLAVSPAFGQGGARRRLSNAEIAKAASPAIVTILTKTSQGSGVIVDPSGVIVTNLHVIRGQQAATVKIASGDMYDDVTVVDVDERKDLVLIKIKAFGLPAASLGNSDQLVSGDHVVLIGSPRGLDLTVSDGLVSAVRDSGEGYRLIQTSAAASPGSSGGGMFNDYGELVAVVSAKLTNGENINFGVPVNYLRGLLSTQPRMTLSDLAAKYPASSAPAGTDARVSAPAQAQAPSPAFLKLQSLVGGMQLQKEKSTDTSWIVRFSGNHAKTVPVYISEYQGYALVQGIVVKNVTLTPEQMNALLKRNFSTDLVRASISDDRSLMIVGEVELRILDVAGLERLTNEVGQLSDDVFGYLDGSPALGTRAPITGPPAGRLRSLSLLQGHAAMQYDTAHWKEDTNAKDPNITQFIHDSDALFARVIAEKVEIPIEKMVDIALENARKLDPKAKETQRGYRTVNGRRMLFVEFEATANNLPITYYGHYYSDSSGTVQIIGWTHRTIIDAYRDDIEAFVSGFTIKK